MFPLIQLVVLAILTQSCAPMFMPGRSYRGELPPLTEQETQLKERLFKHVDMLAGVIGQRNMFTPGSLESSVKVPVRHVASHGLRRSGADLRHPRYDPEEPGGADQRHEAATGDRRGRSPLRHAGPRARRERQRLGRRGDAGDFADAAREQAPRGRSASSRS